MGMGERGLLFDATAVTVSGGRDAAASKLRVEVVMCVCVCMHTHVVRAIRIVE